MTVRVAALDCPRPAAGQLRRAAVELAKLWRQDRVLRHLQVRGRGQAPAQAQGPLALRRCRRAVQSAAPPPPPNQHPHPLSHAPASIIVADASTCLEVSGSGEVLEPADGVHAIGSGSRFAVAAARALMDVEGWTAEGIARRAMEIAAQRCVYTNNEFILESVGSDGSQAAKQR